MTKARHPEKVNKPYNPIKKKPNWIRSKILDTRLFFKTKTYYFFWDSVCCICNILCVHGQDSCELFFYVVQEFHLPLVPDLSFSFSSTPLLLILSFKFSIKNPFPDNLIKKY